jgi:hypothetical protein
MRAGAATVVDIAAYLGVTPARVRQIIAAHHITPTGQRWKAKLYDPRDVFRHAGAHHRGKRSHDAAS